MEMTTSTRLFIAVILLTYFFLALSLMRETARQERRARQRKRELNQSIVNRRVP